MQKKVKKKISKKKPRQTQAKTEKFKFSLSDKTLSSAITCLKELDTRQKGASKDLFAPTQDSMLYLTLLVNTLPTKTNVKPVRIPLTRGLHSDPQTRFCMIVSDQFKQAYKSQLKHASLARWKFLSYDKLRRNFKTFAEKRTLFNSYDLFFCEGRVYMLIRKMLGKVFYERKKYPFPVEFDHCLRGESDAAESTALVPVFREGSVAHVVSFEGRSLDVDKLAAMLAELSLRSTFFYQGNGPEYSLKVGRLSGDLKSLLKNIRVATKFLLKHLVGMGLRLKSVRRLSLKLAQTESFPIYSYLTPVEKKFMRQVLASN